MSDQLTPGKAGVVGLEVWTGLQGFSPEIWRLVTSVVAAAKNGLSGCVGAVKEISTQPGNKHFAAVGLDRFATSNPWHHLSTGS